MHLLGEGHATIERLLPCAGARVGHVLHAGEVLGKVGHLRRWRVVRVGLAQVVAHLGRLAHARMNEVVRAHDGGQAIVDVFEDVLVFVLKVLVELVMLLVELVFEVVDVVDVVEFVVLALV